MYACGLNHFLSTAELGHQSQDLSHEVSDSFNMKRFDGSELSSLCGTVMTQHDNFYTKSCSENMFEL